MKQIFIGLLFIFSILNNTYSQKNIAPDSKSLTKVKELKTLFPDDNVALEASKDYITFGFNNKTGKVTVNHKLNETLLNLDSRADIQKYCFYDGESEIVEFSTKYRNNKSARFYVKDEAYKSEDLFHVDTRVKYANIDFPLKGYKYLSTIVKEYKDIKYFTQLFFNDIYPIEKKTTTIVVPNWLNIELKELNFDGYDITKKVSKDEKTQSTIYTYSVENIHAKHKEENSPGPTYIYPHLLILPKSHTKKGEEQLIFNSTQDLYNWYSSLVKSLTNAEKPFKEKVAELTANAINDDEKIKNIYYWVQDNIRYIAFEDGIAGFKPDEAYNVYNKKYGDCKGMANLIKEMLLEAGFDARLTWIGTKRIAYDYSTPNLSVDNHMICTLMKDDETIYLDGTEKFNSFKEYANRIQGKQVLIENGDDYILKTVPSTTSSFNKEIVSYDLILENEVIKGTINKTFDGESRTGLLYYFNVIQNDKKEDFLTWYLDEGNGNIEVSNINTSDLKNRDITLQISYDVNLKNAVSTFDNDVYIDIDFEKELADFQLDERKTDYIFSFKRELESTATLTIPANYKITQLPQNISHSTDDYTVDVTFEQQNNNIVYKKHFALKNAKVSTQNFEDWNKVMKELNSIYNEQIVLTKQ